MAVRVFFSFFFYRPSVNTFPPKWTDPISITIGGGISACITSRDTSFVVCCNLLCGRRMQVLRRWMESELLEKEEENRQRYNRLLLHTRKEPTTPGGAGGQERDNRPRPWLHLGRWLGLFLFFFFAKKDQGQGRVLNFGSRFASLPSLASSLRVSLCTVVMFFSPLLLFFLFFLPTHRPSIPPTQKTASAPTTFPREKKMEINILLPSSKVGTRVERNNLLLASTSSSMPAKCRLVVVVSHWPGFLSIWPAIRSGEREENK